MGEIKYVNPVESEKQGEWPPMHRLDLEIDGQKIGGAEIEYFSKPIPLYQVSELYIDNEYKGKGYASKIMDQVENWLKERRKPGVLVDAILQGDPASGFYSRRGWLEVPSSLGLHVFNWPKDVDIKKLNGFHFRYTHHSQRGSN